MSDNHSNSNNSLPTLAFYIMANQPPFDFSGVYGVPPAQPSEEDRKREAIQQDFERLVKEIKARVLNSGGKQLAAEDMEPSVELLLQSATTIPFGDIFNNTKLLVGDTGDKFLTILNACGRGVITKLMRELYVPRFLKARGITFAELEQHARASNRSIVAMMGLGEGVFRDKFNHTLDSFRRNDENVQPNRSNVNVPVNPNLQGMGQDLFGARGASQGGVQFNQQQQSVNTETRPPFDAQFGPNMNGSSNMNRSSLPTADAPVSFGQGNNGTGNIFPNSQGGEGFYDGATPVRSHVASQSQQQQTTLPSEQAEKMNMDTPPATNVSSGFAAPPGGGGGYAGTEAPPAVVATTEDQSVSTIGSVGTAPPILSWTTATAKVSMPSNSAATTVPRTPLTSGASAKSAPPGNAVNRPPSSVSISRRYHQHQTPKNHTSGRSRRPLTSRRHENIRTDYQDVSNTPAKSRREVKEQIEQGEVPLEDASLDFDLKKLKATIVAPDKATYRELDVERQAYHQNIRDLSNRDAMEIHFSKIDDPKHPTYHLRLARALENMEDHASTHHHRDLLEAEQEKVQAEQDRISEMKDDITENVAFVNSQVELNIERKTKVAEEAIKQLQQEIAKITSDHEADVKDLRFRASANQKHADQHLATLERFNIELKQDNASRLAIFLALRQCELDAINLLERAVDIRDDEKETTEQFVEDVKTDKEAFFAQLSLIENQDLETLVQQAMEILYG